MEKELCELATIVAEIIRRMGASYGPTDEWKRDFTRVVKIMERANKKLST